MSTGRTSGPKSETDFVLIKMFGLEGSGPDWPDPAGPGYYKC